MHLKVKLRHPAADLFFKAIALDVPILQEYNLADLLILLPEAVVFGLTHQHRASFIAVYDHALLFLLEAIAFLHELLVVLKALLDTCFLRVANHGEGVAFLLLRLLEHVKAFVLLH